MKPEEHIRKYTTLYDKKLKKICEPLQLFGIDTFWRFSITKKGYITYLGNQAPIAEYFYSNKSYKNHPSFRSPKFIPSGTILINQETHPDYHNGQANVRDQYSLDQIMIIGEKRDGDYYEYAFGATKIIPNLSYIYSHKFTLFRKFVRYFLDEVKILIKKVEVNKVDIGSLLGEKFYQDNKEDDDSLDTAFLKKVGQKSNLSKREQECMSKLVLGYSANQIAKELGLSKRTIEHYLENLKSKWGCINKQELIQRSLHEVYENL